MSKPEATDSLQTPLGEALFFEGFVPGVRGRLVSLLEADERIVQKGHYFRDVTEYLFRIQRDPGLVSEIMMREAIDAIYQKSISTQPETQNKVQ